MNTTNILNHIRFSDEKMQKVPIFDSDKMLFDLYCLQPGQFQKVHSHAGEDKVYLVLQGSAVVTLGESEHILEKNESAFAPAGVAHGVRNDSGENLVLLVTMSPRPKSAKK